MIETRNTSQSKRRWIAVVVILGLVAVATASGLKDVGSASSAPVPAVEPDLDDLRRALGEHYGVDV